MDYCFQTSSSRETFSTLEVLLSQLHGDTIPGSTTWGLELELVQTSGTGHTFLDIPHSESLVRECGVPTDWQPWLSADVEA